MAEDQKVKEYGIREVYKPDDETKKTIAMVYDRRRMMEDSEDRQDTMAIADQAEKQYEAHRTHRGEDDWQSNHYVPLTTSVVETALSEIIRQNLRPFIVARGKEDIMKVKLMQYIWDYAWDVSDGDLMMYDVIKDFLINGTVIAQEYYRVDRRKIGSVSLGKDKKETVSYKEVVDYEDVTTEVVKLQDFYVDEFARSFSGPYAARDCIRRYVMNIDDFHDMYDNSVWDQFESAKFVKAGGQIDYYEYFKPPTGVDTSKQVEVLHYWNKPRDKFIIVANDILIRDNPNPYRHKQLPFIRGTDLKRVHRFYGKGEPELLESIQDETNVLRRMIIDRNHLDIDKMFFISNKLGLSDEDLIARPHGLIPTDDVNSAKAVEYGDIPRSVELSLKHLEDDATISTGINPRAQAMPTAGTATEAAILKESTLRRIELKMWLLKRDFLIRLGRLRLANILQFYSQPKLEKIVGEKNSQEYQQKVASLKERGLFEEIGNEQYAKSYRSIPIKDKEISFDKKGKMQEKEVKGTTYFEVRPEYFMPVEAGGYDVQFEAGTNIEISKPLMQSKILELYDRFMQLALQVPGSYDPVKLGDMVLEEYFDKNPDDFKPEQPGMDQEQEQVQMQLQMASMEIKQLMQGKQVPATPYASPIHTRTILEFMNSDEFQKLPNDSPIIKIFTDHVMGEIMAQEARNLQGVTAPQQQNQLMETQMQSVPAKGGTQATSVSQGKQNRPNGMAKPATKTADILPSLNTGGNKNLS